jgi:2'-5' RNA ligase
MSAPGKISPGSDRSRVFFALWPEADVRKRLHALSGSLHDRLGGRRTHPDTLHLTLIFVGEGDDALLTPMREAASRVVVPPFEMVFDRLDCWRHNRIAHVGLTKTPAALDSLVDSLGAALRKVGIPFDARPFKAHVTLLRKADCMKFGGQNENPALEPIRWSARDFVLVRSSLRPEGARYERLAGWPLL